MGHIATVWYVSVYTRLIFHFAMSLLTIYPCVEMEAAKRRAIIKKRKRLEAKPCGDGFIQTIHKKEVS